MIICLCLTASLLTIGAGWFFVVPNHLLMGIFLHLLAALSLFFAAFRVQNNESAAMATRYYSWLAAWFSLFIPILGLPAILLIIILIKLFRPGGLAESYQEDTELILKIEAAMAPISDMDAYMHGEINIEPIRDILSSQDENLKRGAINYLSRNPSPATIRILQQCISDNDPDIRLFAHTALTRIDEGFVQAIQERADLKNKSNDDYFQLALAYRKYAESTLLEAGTADHYFELASLSFAKVSRGDENYSTARFNLGEIAARTDYAKASSYFSTLPQGHRLGAKALIALCRLNFEGGNFLELRDCLNQLRDLKASNDIEPELKQLVSFWTTPLEVKEVVS